MPSLEPRHRGCQCFVCPHQMLMREPRGARGPIEWPNIASVLAVDEQTVAFGDYNRETASHRATLAPVDNCGDVDKMCSLLLGGLPRHPPCVVSLVFC